jgi:hypothetical protein
VLFSCSGPTCDYGWGDCNSDPSDGCETDLTSSSQSCGVCGFPCAAGTSCNAASCFTPEDVATLAGAQGGTFAVGGGYAYVLTLGALFAVSLPDGATRVLTASNASMLFADDDGAYWVEPGVDGGSAVLRTITPTPVGAAPRTVSAHADDVSAIVGSDSGHLFITRGAAHCLSWLDKSGARQEDIACDPALGPSGTYGGSSASLPWAAVVAGTAFWLKSGVLVARPFPEGSATTVSTAFDALGIAASAGDVYGAGNGYERLERATGQVSALVTSMSPPSAIAADDVALFAVSGGIVWRYGVDGSQTVLAGLQVAVSGVAVDETYVYWMVPTTSDAGPSGLTLRRLPKTP